VIDFAAEVGDFQRALASVQACIPTRSTMPILACVLLRASAGKVSVFASSVDREAEDEIAADVGQDGVVAIHGAMLGAMLSKLPKASTVTVQPIPGRENGLKIACGRTSYQLATLEADTMPTMSAVEGVELKIKAVDLAEMIASVAHCAANDESRWHMAGLNLRLDREARDLVATGFDGGQRCAIARVALEELPEAEVASVTIPNHAIRQIEKMCVDGGVVELSIEVSRVELRLGSSVLRTRLIDGEYPHAQIARIPEPTKRLFETNADQLAEVAERVCAVFRRIGDNKILPAVGLLSKDGELEVVAGGTRGVDEASDVLVVDELARFPELALVTEQLVQALGVFKGCRVSVFQEQAGFPIAITSAEKPGLKYYLAPMIRR
jgi:DNA polymerase-3 subunit beta